MYSRNHVAFYFAWNENMSINLIVVELGQMIINVCILCVSNSAPPESPEVKEPV